LEIVGSAIAETMTIAASATIRHTIDQNQLETRSAFSMHELLRMNPRAEALKRRTFKFALEVIAFCPVLRKTWEGRELSDQLFRSGTRVGANYHAACRARSHADFVNKIGIVVEEADESVYWLKVIRAANLAPDGSVAPLLQEARELWAIFNQSQLTAKSNSAGNRNLSKSHTKFVNS
jgi:four helix bundle protein